MKSPYCCFVAIDVETGGLPDSKRKAVYDIALTEVAFVTIGSGLNIIDKHSWLIKPYKDGLSYDKGAEVASGISKEMCERDGRDLNECVTEMILVLKKYKVGNALPILLGHNYIKFDDAFMRNAFEFCKQDLNKYANPVPEDTIHWARLAWEESLNYKLGTCCERAGITLKDAHRALTDTVATAQLWIHFMKGLRGLNGSAAVGAAQNRTRATFEL